VSASTLLLSSLVTASVGIWSRGQGHLFCRCLLRAMRCICWRCRCFAGLAPLGNLSSVLPWFLDGLSEFVAVLAVFLV
jgi:hypothetical protein